MGVQGGGNHSHIGQPMHQQSADASTFNQTKTTQLAQGTIQQANSTPTESGINSTSKAPPTNFISKIIAFFMSPITFLFGQRCPPDKLSSGVNASTQPGPPKPNIIIRMISSASATSASRPTSSGIPAMQPLGEPSGLSMSIVDIEPTEMKSDTYSGTTATVGYASATGRTNDEDAGRSRHGQEDFVLQGEIEGLGTFCGVADGHGRSDGDLGSRYVVINFQEIFTAKLGEIPENTTVTKETLDQATSETLTQLSNEIQTRWGNNSGVGTTLSLSLHLNSGETYRINIGDSETFKLQDDQYGTGTEIETTEDMKVLDAIVPPKPTKAKLVSENKVLNTKTYQWKDGSHIYRAKIITGERNGEMITTEVRSKYPSTTTNVDTAKPLDSVTIDRTNDGKVKTVIVNQLGVISDLGNPTAKRNTHTVLDTTVGEKTVEAAYSDGIREVLSHKQVAEIIKHGIENGRNEKGLAEDIVKIAYREGSHDNLSCTISMKNKRK